MVLETTPGALPRKVHSWFLPLGAPMLSQGLAMSQDIFPVTLGVHSLIQHHTGVESLGHHPPGSVVQG